MWEAKSTKIKDGESIKSASYTYKILKELNDGKMAVAYHAKRSDGKDIFLKHTKDPNHYHDTYAEYVKAQHQILSVLNSIGSEHVEKNYEYFEFEGRHFQAKEFLKGVDLKSILWTKDKAEMMNFSTRFEVIERLAELIKIIHDKDLIHSDLKPEQVFMTKDASHKSGYSIKLIDFDHSIIPSKNIYLPAGTPTWYSPEHNRTNKTVGAYSDIFTLGNMFYTIMAFGKKPFSDFVDSDANYKSAITKRHSVVPLKSLNQAYPQELSDLVQEMLHPTDTKRPSATEVYQRILDLKQSSQTPKFIKLFMGTQSRIITDKLIFGRAMAKSSFKDYKEIFTKQFEVIKDAKGEWFIKGLPIPKSAKSRSGEVFYFYPTTVAGEDITNKIVKIEDGMNIIISQTKLTIKTKS